MIQSPTIKRVGRFTSGYSGWMNIQTRWIFRPGWIFDLVGYSDSLDIPSQLYIPSRWVFRLACHVTKWISCVERHAVSFHWLPDLSNAFRNVYVFGADRCSNSLKRILVARAESSKLLQLRYFFKTSSIAGN